MDASAFSVVQPGAFLSRMASPTSLCSRNSVPANPQVGAPRGRSSHAIATASPPQPPKTRSGRRVPTFRKLQERHQNGPAAFREGLKETEFRKESALRIRRSRENCTLLSELVLGAECYGTVQNLVRHGAYVDIGAQKDGLVHIRDMSVEFVYTPGDLVQTGDRVKVWIKYVDPITNVLGLTMIKPQISMERRTRVCDIVPGMRYDGVVARITNYGAYIDIGAERLAFLQVSNMWGRRPRETLNSLQLGRKIWVHVDDVDEIRSHIKLRARGVANLPLDKTSELAETCKESVDVNTSRPDKSVVFARPGEEQQLSAAELSAEPAASGRAEYDSDESLQSDHARALHENEGEEGISNTDASQVGEDAPDLRTMEDIQQMIDSNTEFVNMDPL